MTAPDATRRDGWSPDAAAAVADAVRARRAELGLSQAALGGMRRGPAVATWERLERERRIPRDVRIRDAIEDSLGWARGTFDSFRADPTHVPEVVPGQVDALVPIGGDIPLLARLIGEATVEQVRDAVAMDRERRRSAS